MKIDKIFMKSFIVIFLFTITGCSEAPVSISEEMHTIEEGADGKGLAASADKLADKLGISEEKWEESILANDGTTINISAKVEVPDTNHMSILSMEKKEFTPEKRKELVEKLCEKGEIYAFESDDMPKWFWAPMIEELNKEIADILEAKDKNVTITGVSTGTWTNDDEIYYNDKISELSSLNEIYQNAPEMGKAPGTYEGLNYTAQGENGRIVIYFHGNNENIESVSWDMEGIHTVKEDFSLTDSYGINVEGTDWGNICEITEEEAARDAKEYIQSFGYTDFEVTETKPLTWERYRVSASTESWTDGYAFTFTRSIDGILEDVTGYYVESGEENVGSYDHAFGEKIIVYINDTGIFHCAIINPYEIQEIVSTDTLLLSYDQIKNIMKEFAPKGTVLSGGGTSYSQMELIYFLDRSAENVSLIPAWRLCKTGEWAGSIYATNYVLLNAIDGSIIDIKGQSSVNSEDADET